MRHIITDSTLIFITLLVVVIVGVLQSCDPFQKPRTTVSVAVLDSTSQIIEYAEVRLSIKSLFADGNDSNNLYDITHSTDFEGKVNFELTKTFAQTKTKNLLGYLAVEISTVNGEDSLDKQDFISIDRELNNTYEIVLE